MHTPFDTANPRIENRIIEIHPLLTFMRPHLSAGHHRQPSSSAGLAGEGGAGEAGVELAGAPQAHGEVGSHDEDPHGVQEHQHGHARPEGLQQGAPQAEHVRVAASSSGPAAAAGAAAGDPLRRHSEWLIADLRPCRVKLLLGHPKRPIPLALASLGAGLDRRQWLVIELLL